MPFPHTKEPQSDEEATVAASYADDCHHAPDRSSLVEPQSRGVRQMEYLNTRINLKYRICLYTGFTLLAYVLSLGSSGISGPARSTLMTC